MITLTRILRQPKLFHNFSYCKHIRSSNVHFVTRESFSKASNFPKVPKDSKRLENVLSQFTPASQLEIKPNDNKPSEKSHPHHQGSPKKIYDTPTLNEEQLNAVNYSFEKPLIIQAGPGSGKTATLLARVESMLLSGIHSYSICVFTFTNKAAKEMRYRLKSHLDPNVIAALTVTTFHAFCLKLLRDTKKIEENASILDEGDQYRLIRSCFRTYRQRRAEEPIDVTKNRERSKYDWIMNKDDEKVAVEELHECISFVKSRGYGVESASRFADREDTLLFQMYETSKTQINAIDFDDMINMTVKLLREDEAVRNQYQGRFRYILVDEFQDTSKVQFELLHELAQYHKRVTVVGDINQSIYEWRGASLENWDLFAKSFPEFGKVQLRTNYRSTNSIVSACNALLRHEFAKRGELGVHSFNIEGERVQLVSCMNTFEEAEFIASTINRLVTVEKTHTYSDFAVLYRNNITSITLQPIMLKYKIPYRVAKGVEALSRKINMNIIAYFRCIINPVDNVAFLRILNTPSRGIGDKAVEILTKELDKSSHNSFMRLIQEMKTKPEGLQNKQFESVRQLAQLFQDWQSLAEGRQVKPSTLIEQIIEGTNWPLESGEADAIKVLSTTADSWREEGETNETVSDLTCKERITRFMHEFSLDGETVGQDEPTDENVVTLSTIHQAKGLEWKNVFCADINEKVIPTTMRRSSYHHYEVEDEEKRLLYVAMSRARERLWITFSRLSRFIAHDNSLLKLVNNKMFQSERFNVGNRFKYRK